MGHALTRTAFLLVIGVGALIAGLRVAQPTDVLAQCVPFGFDTYEARTSGSDIYAYTRAIEMAAAGIAVTSTYTVNGETYDFRFKGLESGPRGARLPANTENRVPPSIFKAMIHIESGWEHGSGDHPVTSWGGVGPIKRADEPGAACGYGLAQITSGMVNNGNATAIQAAIGSHYVFNLAQGINILAEKWNLSPNVFPVAGKGNPEYLEDWYFAIWAYNGFAGQNHPLSNTTEVVAWSDHPLNPFRDPLRGEVFHCYDSSAPNYSSLPPRAFTYPERVYGCMRYPPRYTPLGESSQRMWEPQTFNMPDLSIPEIGEAFKPANFIDCYFSGFRGCASMDFPTSLPEHQIEPHKDTHGPPEVVDLFRSPQIVVGGPTSVSLKVVNGTPEVSSVVTVRNAGTWVAPYRVRYSASWLHVSREDDPTSRRLHAGVAIGSETAVRPSPTAPLVPGGFEARLRITVIPSQLPASGVASGSVFIEPLLGGPVTEIPVSVMQGEAGLEFSLTVPAMARD